MVTRRLMWAAVAAAACGLPCTRSVWAQQEAPISSASEAMTDKARELYTEGRELYAQGKLEAARASLLAAWSLKEHWQIAGMLGFCELEMGKALEAAGHLTIAVRKGAGSAEPGEVAKLRAALGRAKAQVGAARVQVNVPGAELLVDGKLVGMAPFVDPVFLEPGKHVLQARDGTNVSSEVQVEVGAGGNVEVALRLDGSGAAPAVDGGVQQDQGENRPSVVPVIVGGSVAAVGLGVGVGFLLSARGKESDRNDAVTALGGASACGAGTPHGPQCANIQDLNDDAASQRTIATVGFVLFGTALAGTAAYWFWPRAAGEKATTTALVPVLGPGAAGVQLAGSF